MLRYFASSFFLLLLFTHCSHEKPDIRVVCEKMSSGSYKIKWETFPPIEGTVKIYESSVPDSFNLLFPIAEAEIKKGFRDVFTSNSNKRSYFKLVFNKKESVITAERTIQMQGLFNFRDLGGYRNEDGGLIKWGKLYRSSSLSNVTLQDVEFLKNLCIKTVIDFRTEREIYKEPSKYFTNQVFTFPLRGNPSKIFLDRILSKKWKIGEVRVYHQDIFCFLLENNFDYFKQMFDILLDAENYPVILSCAAGKDRAAVAAALIIAALNIDMDQIIGDYMLTNEQIDVNSYLSDVLENILLQDDPEVQETFTALSRVHRGAITYSFDKIIKEYESLDNFFTVALELTPKKREKLKEILLY